MANITIFDTTLRDGEQAPGFSMNLEEKLQMAYQLARLKVDVIEAGFPISSVGDFESVNSIAKKIKGPVICGLARMLEKDILSAAKALKPAKKKRIHVFISTSDIHIKHQMKKTRKDVVSMIRKGVKQASGFTGDVEFSAMDASRSEPEFLYEVFNEAVKAGATTLNIPDTVGYAIPGEFDRLISGIIENVEAGGKVRFSIHCHNDLGLATSNSLAAITAGVRQIECAINGIGERAGNTSLEEVVMAIKTRKDFFGHTTKIKTEEISNTSRLLTAISGIAVQPNKAIVGKNAFAHEAGIHQDGILKKRETFEIMTAESIGLGASKMVMGKHSGRHAFGKKIAELGFKLDKGQLDAAFKRFKELADRKKEVFDEDIEALLGEEIGSRSATYTIESFHVSTGSGSIPTATVSLLKQGNKKPLVSTATGDGPIDAIYLAIDKLTGMDGRLVNYGVRSATADKDAVGEVTVMVEFKKWKAVRGRAASTDTMEASAKAYLNALNRAINENGAEK